MTEIIATAYAVYAHPDIETYKYVGQFPKRSLAVKYAKAAARDPQNEGIAHVRLVMTLADGTVETCEECTVDDEGEVC